MTTGVTCELYVDGVRVADGSPGDDPLAPTALSGLALTWGRSTTVDQPDPSTLTFDLLDEPGGASFIGTFRTGVPVQVLATGIIYGDPTESTVVDPSFSGVPLGTMPGNLHRVNGYQTAVVDFGDGHALRLQPKNRANWHSVVIAPDAFSDLPEAWDDIPVTGSGQTWSVSVDVFAPTGAVVSMRPVSFADPTKNHITPWQVGTGLIGSGTWQTMTVQAVPPAAGQWVGVLLEVAPPGYTWQGIPGVWTDYPGSWLDRVYVYADNVNILAPAEGTSRTVLVFDGRVTDVEAAFDNDAAAPIVTVTAVDFTADLANIRIGDVPWTVEGFETRFNRVLALSGLDVESIIDPAVAAVPLSYQDVDAQPVADLLKDYTQSVDAVLWSAVHLSTGPYLRVEGMATRPPGFMLTDDGTTPPGTVVIGPAPASAQQAISACDVLRDPITWRQTVADVATGVEVGWLEQTTDDDGKPTTKDRVVRMIDGPLEAEYGPRRASVDTVLAYEPDAVNVAESVLWRSSFVGWRVDGITVEDASIVATDADAVSMVLRLLDGTVRNGLPLILTDLPDWSPVTSGRVPLYLEGGSYTFDNGGWVLELAASDATGQGASVAWSELDSGWMWNEFDRAITWNDLNGVGPELAEGT